MTKAIVLGLTGQTGAGKSSVSKIIREEFPEETVHIIDCDLVSREVLKEEKRCLAEIALEFGCQYLTIKGELDRRKLGEVVFADRKKLQKLNQIIFPFIIKSIKEKINDKLYQTKLIILDAPTLFESGSDKFCDKIMSVVAEESVRKRRIMERDDISYEHASNRIASQHDDDFYKSKSDFVIENNDGITDLKRMALYDIYSILDQKDSLGGE